MSARQTAENYNSQSERYERRWKGYLSNTHQKLLKYFHSEPGDLILDVSAGTGMMARELKEQGYPYSRLCLNDLSTGMLDMAKEHHSEDPSIEFNNDPCDHLIYKSSEFDSVICLNAFHHYHRKEQFTREMHRVLKPGGKLYLLDWNRKSWFRPVNYIIDLFTDEYIQTYSAEEARELFESYPFKTTGLQEWRYRYWNLFLLVLEKQSR